MRHLVTAAVIAAISLSSTTTAAEELAAEGPPAAESAAETTRVAILGLRNDGVDEALVPQVVDALALRISKSPRTDVVTTTDIAAVLGLEATRQALDCEEGSCAAMDEITRALDVRYTVAGSIAPRRDGFYVHASLVDVKEGRAIARSGVLVQSDDYAAALAPLVAELLTGLHGEAPAGDASGSAGAAQASATGLPLVSWVGVGLVGMGAVMAGAGAVVWLVDDVTIRDETSLFADKQSARDRYLLDQAVVAAGLTVAALGAGAIAAGLAFSE